MDGAFADLNKIFTFALLRFEGKSVQDLEKIFGRCNGDYDLLFESMIKKVPLNTQNKIVYFALITNDSQSLQLKCKQILYKLSKDIVLVGVFKNFNDVVRYQGFCILNSYVSSFIDVVDDNKQQYSFRIIVDNNMPKMNGDLFPLFIEDVCDLNRCVRNSSEYEQTITRIRNNSTAHLNYNTKNKIDAGDNKDRPINGYSKEFATRDKNQRMILYEYRQRLENKDIDAIKDMSRIVGNPYVDEYLGIIYSDGLYVEKDFRKSMDYYQKALNFFKNGPPRKYTEVMNHIASNYCDKDNPDVDYKEALKWFRLDQYANFKAYLQHSHCSFINGNWEDAFNSAVRVVELKKKEGYYLLGNFFSDETLNQKIPYLETDYLLASRCYAASRTTTAFKKKSMARLADLLVKDKISARESPVAFSALLALARNYGEWTVELGRAYYYGRYGLDKNYAKADECFENNITSIRQKPSVAIAYSELILRGLSKTNKKDVKTIIDMAEQIHPNSIQLMNCKGIYLYHGFGYDVDKQASYDYFSKVLEQFPTDTIALSYVAMLKIDGLMIKQDIKDGFQFLSDLVEDDSVHGHRAYTHYLLAECYYWGKGVPKDYSKAFDLYKISLDTSAGMKLFDIPSKMIDCLIKTGINDNERILEIALESKHSADYKAEELAGDLLSFKDEYLAMSYYYESYRNGSRTALAKYQKISSNYSDSDTSGRRTIEDLKISELEKSIEVFDTRFGSDNVTSQRCNKLISILSGDSSVDDLDDEDRPIIQEES